MNKKERVGFIPTANFIEFIWFFTGVRMNNILLQEFLEENLTEEEVSLFNKQHFDVVSKYELDLDALS